MEAAQLDNVDWSVPWLAPIAKIGRALHRADWREQLNRFAAQRRICNSGGAHIAFVDEDAAGEEPYEAFIARTGCVPTRANKHDLFNALMWLRLPQAKARMNQLQSEAIAQNGVHATRGALRDALTLIDENAVLLITQREDIVDLLRAHDWNSLFDKSRAAWSFEVSIIAFGHALLEKLVSPYKSITAHAVHIPLVARCSIEKVDRYFTDMLDQHLSTGDLMPLPVLGIPGWWPRNEDAAFYSDATVFRPAKMRAATVRRAS